MGDVFIEGVFEKDYNECQVVVEEVEDGGPSR